MSSSSQDRRRRKAPEEQRSHASAWHDDLAETQEPSYPPADFATYSEQKRYQLPHHTPRNSQTLGTEVPTEPENIQYQLQDYLVTGYENVNYPSRDYYEPPTANSTNTSSVTDGLAAMNLTSIPSMYPPVTPYGSREPSAMSQDQRNDSATPKNLALSRHISLDATYGWAMKLDPDYQVRDQGFYRLGRSFSILWVDKGSPMPDDASSIRAAILYRKAGLEENIYVRHFVVVEEGGASSFCKCLPVTSCGGLGHKKKGKELAKHALINSKRVARKVDGLVMPLRVVHIALRRLGQI